MSKLWPELETSTTLLRKKKIDIKMMCWKEKRIFSYNWATTFAECMSRTWTLQWMSRAYIPLGVFGCVGTGKAIFFFFALGAFQIFFWPATNTSNYIFVFQYHKTWPKIYQILIKNVHRIICVTCTFHLRWAYINCQRKAKETPGGI